MKLIKPPTRYSFSAINAPSIFLAGSIEMGTAENWQDRVVDELKDKEGFIFNPRRDNWDSSWEQSIDNPQFREQVEWELRALDRVNIILMYFDPNTKSPISLLELGLHAKGEGYFAVCCPKGFWHKGNVDIVCQRYGVDQVKDLDELVQYAIDRV